MADQDNEAALKQHWAASASGDLETEHNIYDDNVLCEYPQSGERIRSRRNLQALRGHHPGKTFRFQRPSHGGLREPLGDGIRDQLRRQAFPDRQHHGV